MEVHIAFGGLELKVSLGHKQRTIYVRGHFRMINGRKVSVRPHFRRK